MRGARVGLPVFGHAVRVRLAPHRAKDRHLGALRFELLLKGLELLLGLLNGSLERADQAADRGENELFSRGVGHGASYMSLTTKTSTIVISSAAEPELLVTVRRA